MTRAGRLERDVRRDLILTAAALVYFRRDPADVTFDDVARAAGVSRALVYNYFGDRRGLLRALGDRARLRLGERIEVQGRHLTPPFARARAHVEMAGDEPELYEAAVTLRPLGSGQLDDGWIASTAIAGAVESVVLAWLRAGRPEPADAVVSQIAALVEGIALSCANLVA
jgi:AcrR family transcriptional regulator